MNIAKFTWLYNGNYGSILQALALQKFLQDNGYEIEDLNYKPSVTTKLKNWLVNHNSVSLITEKIKERKNNENVKENEKFNLRNRRFEDFKKENMRLSKLCRSSRDLKQISKNYDVFICGSDQIWSPKLMNPVYYFDFINEDKIKIAYAPSFGVTQTRDSKKRKMKDYLKKFDFLSVRENQGQELIEELIGEKVPVQVDPTMLLNEETWIQYIDKNPIIAGEYIFCYVLTSNEEYINNIKMFANKKKLKVVIVPTINGPFKTGFEEVPEAGPSEWLNLIKNAKYIFTDSFHGCIFSVIFNREVYLYKRFSDESKKSENSRVYTLTKWLGIEERLIDKNSMNGILELPPINYKLVNEKVNNKKIESGNWLLNTLKESEQRVKRNGKCESN